MHTSTVTIRLTDEQRAALRERAKRLKKSESVVIRELLDREFAEISFGERAAEFIGAVASESPRPPGSFRETIRRNNWRPS